MALRIGKKKDKPGDDWSDSSLSDTGDATSTPTPAVAPATEPADTFATTAPPKKSLSPVLLAAGLVLLLTAAGVGAYFMFLSTPAEDTTMVATADGIPDPGAPVDPADPAAPPSPPDAAQPPAATEPQPKAVVVKPRANTPTGKVAPGRAGLVPPNTKAPAVRPNAGKPPAVAPKPNQPTPVPIMRDGVAGQTGKGLRSATAVPVVQPAPPLTPALQAQLRTLWEQGAAAKWRGDYPAARRAWQRMLQLRPGHPGVQEAINKLPR